MNCNNVSWDKVNPKLKNSKQEHKRKAYQNKRLYFSNYKFCLETSLHFPTTTNAKLQVYIFVDLSIIGFAFCAVTTSRSFQPQQFNLKLTVEIFLN